MAQHRLRILDVLDRLKEHHHVAALVEGFDQVALESDARPRVSRSCVLVGPGVRVHSDHAPRAAREHVRPVALAARHVHDVEPAAALRDPLVDDQVAPVPVVLGRNVGQGPLAGERERGDAGRLLALDVIGVGRPGWRVVDAHESPVSSA